MTPAQVAASSIEEVPEWVDSFVPRVRFDADDVAIVSVSSVLGTSLGFATGHTALGLALGAGLGVAASLGLHGRALARRSAEKAAVVERQAEQREDLIERLLVSPVPAAVFDRAKVYEGEGNLLVEFPATGSFLEVQSCGPERRGLRKTESEFQMLSIAYPGGKEVDIYGLNELKSSYLPKSRTLSAEVSEDGSLRFSSPETPDRGVEYNLNTGDVESERLSIKNGTVTKLELGDHGFGYSYHHGRFEQVNGNWVTTLKRTLPLDFLGVRPSFPSDF